MNLRSLVLAAVLSNAKASFSLRRFLSEKLIAGFEPKSDVQDEARLDLDQQQIEEYLGFGTASSFESAKSVYSKGGFSKSVATLTLDDTLTITVKPGTKVTGKNSDGSSIVLEALELSDKTLKVQYVDGNCNVGGLVGPSSDDSTSSGDQTWDGCLAPNGTIVVEDSSPGYSYPFPSGNTNERTIQSFSTDSSEVNFATFKKFADYYGRADYADAWINAAFDGLSTSFSNGNADFSAYADDYEALEQGVRKATSYWSVNMFIIRMLEEAALCQDDASSSLDQAVAFWAGSLEDTDGSGQGVFMYSLAEKRSENFGTYAAEGKTSKVNQDILMQLDEMQNNLASGKCAEAVKNKDRIAQLLFVPLVQATLRYANIKSTEDADNADICEGATFAGGVLPIVAACNKDDALTIYNNMKTGMVTADYAAVKQAFEKNYACMGISCADVGGILDEGTGKYMEGAAPCASSGWVASLSLAFCSSAALVMALLF